MGGVRELRPRSPRLSVQEAKRILARAVLKIEGERDHDEYKQSLSSIRNSAINFLQTEGRKDKMKKKDCGEEKKKKDGGEEKKKEVRPTPKEIVVQAKEKPGPCPCLNCKNMTHIPGKSLQPASTSRCLIIMCNILTFTYFWMMTQYDLQGWRWLTAVCTVPSTSTRRHTCGPICSFTRVRGTTCAVCAGRTLRGTI